MKADAVLPLQELLACADGGAWEALANRRVQHYGHKFDYKVRIALHNQHV